MSTPSNTLIISGLDRSDFPPKTAPDDATFFTNVLKKYMEETLETRVVHWGLLRSFGRIVAVFSTVQLATSALKLISLSNAELPKGLKACYDVHTPLYTGNGDTVNPEFGQGPDDKHLQLPDKGRLFFISPPPSPPPGWVSQLEESPNTQTFHADLHEALLKIAEAEPEAIGHNDISPFPSETVVSPETGKLVKRITLYSAEPEPAVAAGAANVPTLTLNTAQPPASPTLTTPTIIVEWNQDDEDESFSDCEEAETPKLSENIAITRTGRPPMVSC
ncbi:hypothetical protein D0Z00_000297 [Geotrichum galactomycetum]|uniref:Uncharacterized protein n=1 Tax=Geotrichum galactomycetum TaxID=27317 RepID=A0ACB6VA88_9ASCO|nr:hypothetical protein D0Z00_000297 [Geotrichum candidum]